MYVVKIGARFYAGDDREPSWSKARAVRYPNQELAEVDAAIVRSTWLLKPTRGPTTRVTVAKK